MVSNCTVVIEYMLQSEKTGNVIDQNFFQTTIHQSLEEH